MLMTSTGGSMEIREVVLAMMRAFPKCYTGPQPAADHLQPTWGAAAEEEGDAKVQGGQCDGGPGRAQPARPGRARGSEFGDRQFRRRRRRRDDGGSSHRRARPRHRRRPDRGAGGALDGARGGRERPRAGAGAREPGERRGIYGGGPYQRAREQEASEGVAEGPQVWRQGLWQGAGLEFK
eukprot:4110142-Pyramimonas_sp.AAC.1